GIRKPEREGLPPGYRMRADAHYVDQLTARRAERADRQDDDAPERVGDKVLAHLSEDITSIGSAAGMLTADASPLARRVSIDLIKAQSWRAGWLLRAAALLDNTPRPAARPRPIGPILAQVRDGFAAECRLT